MIKSMTTLPIDEIRPYENNPRLNDDAVEAVRKSMEQCGYIAPIVVDEYHVVLAGHTRLKALKEMGAKECEVLEVARNFSETSVLDLFGGTGTTLIACEQLGRKCYMMELDPHYCDVIISRWENYTGEKAVLIAG